ncbi:unnamed protein product [Rotaria sp. Silwood2]|nr:unnamed protein product [Rotaria sp. Silwood2]CAF2476206.1 unnamed protein product [Rotaria sp. Silwood2]CAF2854792.1 unnamed protein product [Rotaria sp. Silwood2]CAF4112537.1 unnamed protein product [Rotaria sp. Silwood2]CAF4209478.1 unnamed protein product [Rotaria sp. Silwood2]
MVDPYDFVASPPTIKSKQTRKKSIIKTSKKRKSNEKSRRVSIRQTNSKLHIPTRLNIHDTDHLIDMHEKENNPNQGFTQLIETKMMEVKKRQGKRTNKKVKIITDDNHSPLIMKKRQQSEIEDNSDVIPTSTEKDSTCNNFPPSTTDEHVNVGTTKIANPLPCESKDHYLVLANKRRRACLCSKRQLDELEFASDNVPSQTQWQQNEEEQLQEKSHLVDPILNSVNHSPLPLLLPSSILIPPSTSTFTLPPVQSVSINQQEEEEEEENQLHVSSIMAAPLSPAMPLNSTYIARRSIPIITQIPSALLTLSTVIPGNTTTISDNAPSRLTSSIVEHSNLEQNKSDHMSLLAPIKTISNRQDQETSMTPTDVQTITCSVSTQTSDDDDDNYYPTHHPCNDVSLCPCVQIYTRSEQLFMASMSIFFRNSITVTPPEPLLTIIKNRKKKNDKRQQINHPVISPPQPIPLINDIEIPIQIETHTEKHDNIQINQTYVTTNHNDIIPSIEPEPQQLSSHVLLDTSTVINETRNDNSKKSDGSSIQININAKEALNKKSHEENSSLKSFNDQEKFKSLVLAMTALKDDQKIVFNRFIEYFSVRSSASIDETTTHLITDEDDENSLKCPLTGKVLQAVARHLTIVSYRWLKACLNEQCYVDEIPTYEIIGDTIYNTHYGMSHSRLNNSNNYRLLANYAFHLKCHGCQPFIDNRPLIELIHLSGGLILKTLNQHIDNIGRQIIILCSKKYLQNKLALQQACQKLNIFCIEPEWLIASIVKFDIQPYEPWLCTLYS